MERNEFEPLPIEKAGEAIIRATSEKTAYINFKGITLRGVSYKGSLRLRDYGNGLESERENADRPHTAYHALYMHREDKFMVEGTKAARDAIRQLLETAARAYGRKHTPDFQRAELQVLTASLESARQAVIDAEAELKVKVQARKEALEALDAYKKANGL